jgi:4-oxalomesaconate tautomerase
VDLDFLFAQLQPDRDTVDTTPNCGNMLAAVVPFALECALVQPQGDTSTYRVLTLNTGMQCDVMVQTPPGARGRYVEYAGDTHVDGVPTSGAPVSINFLDTAGSVASGLLPTAAVKNVLQVPAQGDDPAFSLEVTCIDNGMPLVIFRATDVGRSGYESVAELNADVDLKNRIERLRIVAGHAMGLGDVTAKNYPKMTLVAPPRAGGAISTRSFIPHVCHDAIGVLAAVTVATACVLRGSVCEGLAVMPEGASKAVSVEHPTGEFSVELQTDPGNPQKVTKAALLRTARLLMQGQAMVPAAVWAGHCAAVQGTT